MNNSNASSLDNQFFSIHVESVTILLSHEDADLGGYWWYIVPNGETAYAFRNNTLEGAKKYTSMHRLILARKLGRPLSDTELVDHIDGDGLNNHRDNLRVATCAENGRNKRRQKSSKSGYKGVSFHKRQGKWIAGIRVNNKREHLGMFSNPEDAFAAYCKRGRELFGEFFNDGTGEC